MTIGDRDQARAKATVEEIGHVSGLSQVTTGSQPDHTRFQTPDPSEPRSSRLFPLPDRRSQSMSPNAAPSLTGIGAGVGVPFQHSLPTQRNGPRPYVHPSNPYHSTNHSALLFQAEGPQVPHKPRLNHRSVSDMHDAYLSQRDSQFARRTWGYQTSSSGTQVPEYRHPLPDHLPRRRATHGSRRTSHSSSHPNLENHAEVGEDENVYPRARFSTSSQAAYPSTRDMNRASMSSIPTTHPTARRPMDFCPQGFHPTSQTVRLEGEKHQLFMSAKAEAGRTQATITGGVPRDSVSLGRNSFTYRIGSSGAIGSSNVATSTSSNVVEAHNDSGYGSSHEARGSGYMTVEEEKRALDASIRSSRLPWTVSPAVPAEAEAEVATVSTLPIYRSLSDQTIESQVQPSGALDMVSGPTTPQRKPPTL